MLRFLLIPLLAAWTGVFASAAAAEVTFPPGGRIGLEVPTGMSASKRGPGFEDTDRKAIIAIVEVPPVAYEELEKSMFDGNAGQRGLTIDKRESFPFADGIGFLVTARATVNDVPLHKWFFLAKTISGAVTAFVTVEVPDKALDKYSDATVRKALSTVTFREPPLAEQLSLLPFKLGDLAGFHVVKVLPNGVILTEGQTDDLTRQPYVIAAVAPGGPENPGDRGPFTRNMLESAPVGNIHITSGEEIRIGGFPAFEIRAQGAGPHGDPIAVVQWVRFGNGGFMRIVCVSRADQWDDMFPRFRTVRDGIMRKD
jgi:hypothetical protein